MTLPMTDENLASLWAHLSRRLRSRPVRKAGKPLMRIASRVVERRTNLSSDEFLDDYVTTIRRRIFIPRAYDQWPFASRFRLAVHEHQHVAQWRRERLRYLIRYAASPRHRAEYEAEAMVADEYAMSRVFGHSVPLPHFERRVRVELRRAYDVPREIAERTALDAELRLMNTATGVVEPPKAARLAMQWARGKGWDGR